MAHYIGVDIGTGSARACIINSNGLIVAVASKDIKTFNPKTDFYEQSTTDIWAACCECTREILKKSKVLPSDVKGIGFDATCSLAVFDQKTDQPIAVDSDFSDTSRNVILWLDHRCPNETLSINATKHNCLKYVGGGMSIEMEIPKILWLKNNMPAEMFDRCKFYDLTDAMEHIATGTEARSYCSTVCKQGFIPVGIDGSVKGWSKDFLEAIGLGELASDDFKRMGGTPESGNFRSAGELAGELCEQAAKDMGLLPGTKIASGVIDAYAGWVGTVAAKVEDSKSILGSDSKNAGDMQQARHRLAAVAGTSTCHLVMSKEPVFVNGVWGPYRDVLFPGYWVAEGGQSCTGNLLHFVLSTHPAYDAAVANAKAKDTNIFDYLNEVLISYAAEMNCPSIGYLLRNLFYYPDLHGNRSPIADSTMRGAISGLDMDTSEVGLAKHYYVAMEAIGLQTRHIVESLNKAGHEIESVFLSGGQCKNKLLVGLIASCTELPVVMPKYINDAVVLGAAMLGAKAATANERGETENLWDIMLRMSHQGTIVHPTQHEGERRLLRAKYSIFLDMAQKQLDYRKQMTAASEDYEK